MQNIDSIANTQNYYIGNILCKLKMLDSKEVDTNEKFTKNTCPETEIKKYEVKNIPYHQLFFFIIAFIG